MTVDELRRALAGHTDDRKVFLEYPGITDIMTTELLSVGTTNDRNGCSVLLSPSPMGLVPFWVRPDAGISSGALGHEAIVKVAQSGKPSFVGTKEDEIREASLDLLLYIAKAAIFQEANPDPGIKRPSIDEVKRLVAVIEAARHPS